MKLKRFWNNFKLRMALLRVWFLKNLMLFVRIACIVCIICIFTGVINEDTPILGKTIYVIFSPLVSEINAVIKERELDGVMNVFAISISILVSVGTFLLKVKTIAKEDIKSSKLKYALYKANMYFNENGELVKKVEKATNTDINGDGKIDEKQLDADTIMTEKTGFFSSIIRSIKELNVIVKAEFDPTEDENSEKYNEVLKEAGLENASDAAKEIDEIVTSGKINLVSDEAIKEIDRRISDVEESDISAEEKTEKVSVFTRLKNWFISLKEKIKLRKENKKKNAVEKQKKRKNKNVETVKNDDVEVVTNNLEKDAEVEKSFEIKNETLTPLPKVNNTPKTSPAVDSFIASLQRKK